MEEIDALAPEQSNRIVFADGGAAFCRMLCDIIHLEGATALASYADNFYAGTPVVTENQYGNGSVYYVGSVLDEAALAKVLDQTVARAKISPILDEDTKLVF